MFYFALNYGLLLESYTLIQAACSYACASLQGSLALISYICIVAALQTGQELRHSLDTRKEEVIRLKREKQQLEERCRQWENDTKVQMCPQFLAT